MSGEGAEEAGGFGSALNGLTGQSSKAWGLDTGLAALQDRAKTALTEASSVVHSVDDLRRQGLQAAREKAAGAALFNLDGLQRAFGVFARLCRRASLVRRASPL